MGARCQVCASPRVSEIHEALLTGASRRAVARAFGLDRSAMDRHWLRHVPEQVRAAANRAEDLQGAPRVQVDAISGDVLLGLMATQYETSRDLLDRLELSLATASPTGLGVDVRAIVAALREVRQSIESLAKLSFSVADRPAVPVASEAPEIDSAIRRALESRGVTVAEPRSEASYSSSRDGMRALEAAPTLDVT